MQEQREEAYRICVTESLRLISENSANLTGGKYYKLKYYDYAHPARQTQGEEQSAQEVIDRIKQKLSKMGGGE